MLDITGYTQEEIEEQFSQENLYEYLAIELEDILNQVTQEHYELISKITKLDGDKTVNFVYDMISTLGSVSLGIYNKDSVRVVEIEHFVSIISDILPEGSYNDRVEIALDLLCELDTIFFDVKQERKVSELNNFYTHTYVELGLTVGSQMEIDLRQGLTRFRLPMIEKPKNWTENNRGGYLDESKKLVSNKGNQHQPQKCLDVLNKLQSNAYTLREYSLAVEYDTILRKLEESNWKQPHKNNSELELTNIKTVTTIMQTTAETYKNMENREFYFVWFFDFRGRMYSRGYDINLQATKIKKAMLKAV